MTKTAKPTKPETLDTEQLDAAVGGVIAAVVGPCNKIVTVAAGGQCNKVPKLTPALPTGRRPQRAAEPAIMAPPRFDDLSALTPRRLARMRRAQRELSVAIRAFRRAGGHPVRDVLGGGPRPFTRYAHYPDDDVDDVPRGYAWYYHAHEPGPSRPWDEHGHFHLYCYPKLFGGKATPLALPAEGDTAREYGITHLFGLCLSERGAPVRLFTINRWASNEHLYAAPDLLPVIDRFTLGRETLYPLVSRWLGALVRLLHPQIGWLMRERDRVLGERRAADPQGYSEDRTLDVVSTLALDLDEVHAALGRNQ